MLAKRLPTILPRLTLEEALETTKIHSIVGFLAPGQALITRRPFHAPHHTASDDGLLGGNINPAQWCRGRRGIHGNPALAVGLPDIILLQQVFFSSKWAKNGCVRS